MIRRLLVMSMLGVGLIQPPLAARELSEDELLMKERLVALSQEAGSLEGLRIELADGNPMTGAGNGIYTIAEGKVVRQEWTGPGSAEKRGERAVTDEQVRGLLRELIEQHYWTFQGTSFTPDAEGFMVRFRYTGLKPVKYRCDAAEYRQSQQLSAIRAVLLTFVSGSLPAEQPLTR